jgi:hypothetical protein
MRKEVPMLITALAGLVVVVGEYLHFGHTAGLLTTFNQWFQVATAVAFPVGLVSLTLVHLHNISRKRQRWAFSVVLLLATYIYLVVSLITGPKTGTAMDWVYQAYIAPASATMYGMIAFLITSAAFRTFKFRSLEVAILIAVSLFLIVGSSPLGDLVIHGWSAAGLWLTATPGGAAYRAVTLGLYLGAFATGIRVLLGIERAHIGGLSR